MNNDTQRFAAPDGTEIVVLRAADYERLRALAEDGEAVVLALAAEARIGAADLHRIIELGKGILRHPVELIPGIREAVADIAADFPVVLVTKGDLFHQEAKVRESGLSRWFHRIEIVSEKDVPTYARLLEEFGVAPAEFVMIGNSLRSDIAPLLELGAWGVHIPYHVTWAHEAEADVDAAHPRLRVAQAAGDLPALVESIASEAASP